MQEESGRGKAFRYLDQTHNVMYDKSEGSGNFQVGFISSMYFTRGSLLFFLKHNFFEILYLRS